MPHRGESRQVVDKTIAKYLIDWKVAKGFLAIAMSLIELKAEKRLICVGIYLIQ